MKKQAIQVLAFLLVGSTLAHASELKEAQASEIKDDNLANLIERNSENCKFTFFSEGDDILDLRGKKGFPCFDLKSGRDILALDPGDYPTGTTVFTGPGRDIVVLPDGDDKVFAFNDEDEEYILRGGNDYVVIPGILATGINIPGRAGRTIIKPGSGRDRIIFGDMSRAEIARMRSPNLEVWGNDPGNLKLEAVCGRYFDSRNIDVTFPENAHEKKVDVEAFGCGLSFPRQSGDLVLYQKGGRLNLTVQSDEWQEGHRPSVIKAKIDNGTSLASGFQTSAKESVFSWHGQGLASFSAEFKKENMGGKFEVSSDKYVYGVVDLSRGNAGFELVASNGIELTLKGALDANIMNFSLKSPSTVVSWYPEFGRFPLVDTKGEVPVRVVKGKKKAAKDDVEGAIRSNDVLLMTEIKRKREGMKGDQEKEDKGPISQYSGLTESENRALLYSAQVTLPVEEEEIVTGMPVNLKIYRGDREGRCIDVSVLDGDGTEPDIEAKCDEESFIADVKEYEKIRLERAGRTMEVLINGESRFQVSTIGFRK
jgi:hypothetical protein